MATYVDQLYTCVTRVRVDVRVTRVYVRVINGYFWGVCAESCIRLCHKRIFSGGVCGVVRLGRVGETTVDKVRNEGFDGIKVSVQGERTSCGGQARRARRRARSARVEQCRNDARGHPPVPLAKQNLS